MSEISDLLERFRRAPDLLATVLTGVHGDEEDFAPAPDKWSIRQVITHLADSEVVAAHRFRQIIAEENPTLIAFDQEAWAKNLAYAQRKPKQCLESFRRLRGETYELLKGLPEEAFARMGNHTERGEITMRFLLEINAQHGENHARQMQAIREAYKKAKAGR